MISMSVVGYVLTVSLVNVSSYVSGILAVLHDNLRGWMLAQYGHLQCKSVVRLVDNCHVFLILYFMHRKYTPGYRRRINALLCNTSKSHWKAWIYQTFCFALLFKWCAFSSVHYVLGPHGEGLQGFWRVHPLERTSSKTMTASTIFTIIRNQAFCISSTKSRTWISACLLNTSFCKFTFRSKKILGSNLVFRIETLRSCIQH